jgi:FtsH-binding integral membrane protein
MSNMCCTAILVTALLGSATVFVCFTLAALLAKRREYLYLGGLLGSAISWMLVLSLLNAFIFRSPLAFTAELYVGLLVFCG